MSKTKTDAELTFEQGLEKLESIVGKMESGELPLDQLISQYEEGTRYLKQCETKLKDAEKKIEILKTKGDQNSFESFDPDK